MRRLALSLPAGLLAAVAAIPAGQALAQAVERLGPGGCAEVAATLGGREVWAQRLGPDRAPLCAPPPAASLPGLSDSAADTDTSDADADVTGSSAGEAASVPDVEGIGTASAPEGAAANPEDAATAAEGTAAASENATLPPPDPVRVIAPQPDRQRPPVFPEPGYYVQVAALADPADTAETIRMLQGNGFGVLRQPLTIRGRRLDVLYAGPFADRAARNAALSVIRGGGFSDAFAWLQE